MLILSVPDYRHLGYRYGTNLVKQVIKRGTGLFSGCGVLSNSIVERRAVRLYLLRRLEQ